MLLLLLGYAAAALCSCCCLLCYGYGAACSAALSRSWCKMCCSDRSTTATEGQILHRSGSEGSESAVILAQPNSRPQQQRRAVCLRRCADQQVLLLCPLRYSMCAACSASGAQRGLRH
jgi:hypothetical protein